MARQKTGSTVTKNGKLYARVQFVDESGRKRDLWRTASSKKDAKEKIKELLKDSESKTAKELDASRMTFNHLADFYEETYLHEAIYINERKVSGLRNIKPTQYQLQSLREHFGNRLIQGITYLDLAKHKLKRLKTPTKRGLQRGITDVNRQLQLLRRILNIALRQGWIIKNPFHNGDSLISLADEPQRSRILSFAEETRLLAEIDNNPQRHHLKGIVLIALDCAFRKKEILTLCRRDIDLINRTITIRAFNSKTAKSRKVGMTNRVYKWLLQYENDAGGLLRRISLIRTFSSSRFADFQFSTGRFSCSRSSSIITLSQVMRLQTINMMPNVIDHIISKGANGNQIVVRRACSFPSLIT